MPSINFEVNLILTQSAKFVISNAAANQATPFAITDAKPYGSLVTLMQLMIMQNYCNNYNQDSNVQLQQHRITKTATQNAPN